MEVAVITICLLVGMTCAMLASSKRRSAIGWFAIGSLLPVIGLVLILVLPGEFAVVPGQGGSREPNATVVARRTHMESATIDAVIRLVDLLERGELTPIEFEEKKFELLARI